MNTCLNFFFKAIKEKIKRKNKRKKEGERGGVGGGGGMVIHIQKNHSNKKKKI